MVLHGIVQRSDSTAMKKHDPRGSSPQHHDHPPGIHILRRSRDFH